MPTSINPYAPHSKASEPSVTVEESKYEQGLKENSTTSVIATEGPEDKSVTASAPVEDTVPEGPAAEVLEWVGDDKDRAKAALEAEEAGQQRVGLTKKLKELAE
jgi:hypothetical protein